MKQPLPAILVILVIILAGCGGGSGGQTPEPITAEATEATVSQAALDAADYSEPDIRQQPYNTTGEIELSGDVQLDLSYQFHATAVAAEYQAEGTPTPVFAVFSVPLIQPDQVDIERNPLKDRSISDIAALSQRTYDEISSVEHIENRTVLMLSEEVSFQLFQAQVGTDGSQTEVRLQYAQVRHNDDVVVAVGITPPSSAETERVITLIEGIEH